MSTDFQQCRVHVWNTSASLKLDTFLFGILWSDNARTVKDYDHNTTNEVWLPSLLHCTCMSLYDIYIIVLAESSESYQGLSLISGIGAQVKKTVTNRKGRLPHTSDSAPIRGADMNDSRPLTWRGKVSVNNVNNPRSEIVLFYIILNKIPHGLVF